MVKTFKINLPEEKRLIQQSLFVEEASSSPSPWPQLGGRVTVEKLLEEDHPLIGLDLEFNRKGKPSIFGLGVDDRAAACSWDDSLAKMLMKGGGKLVGHAVIAADKPVLDGALGEESPLDRWEDSMITHFLCNSNFAAAPGKGEDDDDATALGLMNLWSMSALYTDLPQWKECRGMTCNGPCPTHKVFDYCAVDAWSGLISFQETLKEMKQKRIPYDFYRELVELADIAQRMQVQGVKVSKDRIKDIQTKLDIKKDGLFPHDIEGRKKVYHPFNPKSSPQIIDYFAGKGIVLRTSDINEITKALEKISRKLGVLSLDGLAEKISVDPAGVNERVRGAVELFKLYTYKESGKGLKSWFDEKYITKDSVVHPRWIVTGTSTGRWASSKPNFTNIPKEDEIRSIIVAQEGCQIIKCDFSQMELRVCLYESGFNVTKLVGDPFKSLVVKAGDMFNRAAEIAGRSTREVAKSVSHASSYCEGLQVLMPEDLVRSSITKEVEYGARLLFRDWDYAGGLVSFTGANLAERLFGSKTLEHRKMALQLQELYFAEYPFTLIRPWQKKISHMIQDRHYIQSKTGRYLDLDGTPDENLKTACAFIGQGQGSDFVQEKILDYWRNNKLLWTMFVHDEAVFDYIPQEWDSKKVGEFLLPFTTESKRFPGFVCPFKVKVGPSWGETKEITV